MITSEKLLVITLHPFWEEPLGCGSLLRNRYDVFSKVFRDVYVLYLTRGDDKCPLKGGTIKFQGQITPELIDITQQVIDSQGINFCYFSYVQTSDFPLGLSTFNIVEIHDVIHLRQRSFEAFGVEANIIMDKETELNHLKAYDLVISINLDEEKYLQDQGISRAVWLPPSCVFSVHQNRSPLKSQPSVGFLGSCSKPNMDGLWSVLSLINTLPDFHLAGPISTDAKILNLVPETTTIHGIVEDVSTFYQSVDVMLSPIRFGAGLKIKVFESLAHGLNILATTHSIIGFPPGISDVVLVNNDVSSWDESLLKEAYVRDLPIEEYVNQYFSPDVIERQLRTYLDL